MKLQKLDDLLLNLVVVFEACKIKGVTRLRATETAKHYTCFTGTPLLKILHPPLGTYVYIYSSQAIRKQGTAGYDAETSLTQCCKLNRLNRTKIDIEHCWLDQVHLQHHTKRLFRYQKREQYIWILQVEKVFLKSIITTYSSSLVPRYFLYGRGEKGEVRKGLVNNSTPTQIHRISFMFNC